MNFFFKPLRYIPVFLLVLMITVSCEDETDDTNAIIPVTASFTPSADEVEVDVAVTFTNTSSNANYYVWSFGDGTNSTNENPSHSYSTIGTYRVSLIAIGSESADTAYTTIVVSEEGEESTDDISIYEGVGIDDLVIYESSWADIKAIYGTDTVAETYYYDAGGYYYQVISYYNEGLSFFLYLGSNSATYDNAMLFVVSIWGENYQGGMTKAGVGIGSTIAEMKSAYGEPEDEESGTASLYSYTFYFYDSLGIDFLDYDEDYIYQIDIYYPDDEETNATGLKGAEVKNILRKYQTTPRNTLR